MSMVYFEEEIVRCPYCRSALGLGPTLVRVHAAIGVATFPLWRWVCPDCLHVASFTETARGVRRVERLDVEQLAAIVVGPDNQPVRDVIERLLTARLRARYPIGGPP